MNTIKIEAYTYAELSDKAKQRVQEWFNQDMHLFDKYIQEQWEEDLLKLGYENCDFQYSGFYCQGSGASITCDVHAETFILRNKLGNRFSSLLYWLKTAGTGYVNIKRRTHSQSVGYWTLYIEDESNAQEELDSVSDYVKEVPEKAYNQLLEVSGMILDEVVDKSKELYAWLEADYDYHFTDEYMIDVCDANEYLFDAYGEPVHHLEIE